MGKSADQRNSLHQCRQMRSNLAECPSIRLVYWITSCLPWSPPQLHTLCCRTSKSGETWSSSVQNLWLIAGKDYQVWAGDFAAILVSIDRAELGTILSSDLATVKIETSWWNVNNMFSLCSEICLHGPLLTRWISIITFLNIKLDQTNRKRYKVPPGDLRSYQCANEVKEMFMFSNVQL